MDTTQTKSYWSQKNKQYILDQLRVRGFKNDKHWPEIQKYSKNELDTTVYNCLDNDKWLNQFSINISLRINSLGRPSSL